MDYAWGSRTLLPRLRGAVDVGEREAEMWIGAHPAAPSSVCRDGVEQSLADVAAGDPVGELGVASTQRFGAELPFLLKILAIESPLSLQVHPNEAQARAGFAAEELAGVPRSSAERSFKDCSHKPELVVALTDFSAFCGLRSVESARDLLRVVDAGPIGAMFVEMLDESNPESLMDCVDAAFRASSEDIDASIAALRFSHLSGADPFGAELHWLKALADQWPNDPAVVVATILDLVELRPGDGLFVEAGQLHTYLTGMGVEVMANSDNVLRAGLTPKHVDLFALRSIVDARCPPVIAQEPREEIWTYDAPVEEFELTRVTLHDEAHTLAGGRGRAVVVTDGSLRFQSGDSETAVRAGSALWCSANDGAVVVSGHGTAFVATDRAGYEAR